MLEAARQAITDGVNQYPPGTRHAGAARGDRRPPATFLRAHRRPRHRGARDGRRHRGASPPRCSRSSRRATRSSPSSRSTTPTPRLIALAGGRHVTVPLRAPDFQPDPDDLRAAVTDRTRIILLNTPHNPTGAVLARRDPRTRRRARAPPRRAHRHRRGLRAPHLRRGARAGRHPPGRARAHGDDLQRRQDVQHDRMEGRLDRGAARRCSRRSSRSSSS